MGNIAERKQTAKVGNGSDITDGDDGEGTGVKPSGSESALEKGDYPEPGEGTTGRPTAARGLPTPSRATGCSGTMGDGRGSSGKFAGTMGSGSDGKDPPAKGVV